MSTRNYQPGDPYGVGFTITNASGALANADSTPTATLYHNGTTDGSVTFTVTNTSVGVYGVACTLPGTYAAGDRVSILVNATVGGVATGNFVDHVRLVGYPNNALPNAAAGANGGVPTVDAQNGVRLSVGTGQGQVNVSAGAVPAASVGGLTPPANWGAMSIDSATGGVTVKTNTDKAGYTVATVQDKTGYTVATVQDKTGYTLSQAFPGNFVNLAIDAATGGVTVKSNSDKTGYTVASVQDKTGYVLAATGLDQISVADPGGVSGQNTFPKVMVALYRRFFRKATLTSGQLRTYADDGVTVNTTQAMSDDGTTQTQGTGT